jgi:hypothetical protein
VRRSVVLMGRMQDEEEHQANITIALISPKTNCGAS